MSVLPSGFIPLTLVNFTFILTNKVQDVMITWKSLKPMTVVKTDIRYMVADIYEQNSIRVQIEI